MNEFALDPKLKVVAEVAQELGRTERRIQQMIASGDLAARKATDFEELALRKAGRIRSSTERGVWLIQQEAVQRLKQLRIAALQGTSRSKLGYPKYRPRSKQSKITTANEAAWSVVKHEPLWKVPTTFTSLIGREQDVAMIGALLLRADIRLLTILGTGGIGKTRLSLQVASEMRQHFSDGVCFVSLAAINDPELVVSAIAQELGIPEIGTQPLFEQVQASLHDKQLLLILDNFEQVISASARIEELLVACISLKIVVTSRAVLHLQAEQEFTVSPLALPNLNHLPEHEVLSDYAAVALFVRRAQAIQPAFQVTPQNARSIAEICVRLDGLPLAIELAAARTRLLPPQALLSRLGQRLQILTSSIRDAPARQQTLRKTIQWSYDLLPEEEQYLFRCLSVFVPGCTLEAVEAIGEALGVRSAGVLDEVTSLLEKNLLQQTAEEEDEPRFTMLETIREFGLECLTASKEMEATRRAHALYYFALADEAAPKLVGPRSAKWSQRLEREHDNLRAALEWSLEPAQTGSNPDLALRFCATLKEFWEVRGLYSEGRTFLEQALADCKGASTAARASALGAAAAFAEWLVDMPRQEELVQESLSLYRELGDTRGIASSLQGLAWVHSRKGASIAALQLLEESVTLLRELGDKVPWPGRSPT